MELHGALFLVNYQIYQGLCIYLDGNSDKCHFSSNKEGKLVHKLVDFMEYSRYFHEPQAKLTQGQRKV